MEPDKPIEVGNAGNTDVVKPAQPIQTIPVVTTNPLLKQNTELTTLNKSLTDEVTQLREKNEKLSIDLNLSTEYERELNHNIASMNNKIKELEKSPFNTFPDYTVRQILKDGGMDSQMTEKSLHKLKELFFLK